MIKKRAKKATKKRITILLPIVLVCCLYAIYRIGYYTYHIISLSNTKSELALKLDELKDTESNLKIEIEKLQNPDYLARYAREKYKYSKSDEIILSIDETKEVINHMDKDIKGYTIAVVSGTLILVVAFVSIIIKRKEK